MYRNRAILSNIITQTASADIGTLFEPSSSATEI